MTASQICAIIESSAKASVRSIKFGGLHLELGEGAPASPPRPTQQVPELNSPPEAAISDKEHDQQTKDSLELDEAQIKEERLSLLLIENPYLAEQLIASGELDSEVDDGDEEAL